MPDRIYEDIDDPVAAILEGLADSKRGKSVEARNVSLARAMELVRRSEVGPDRVSAKRRDCKASFVHGR